MRSWPFVLSMLLLGCPAPTPPVDAGCGGSGKPEQVVFGGARPVTISVPRDYDGCPAPLIVVLHGYGAAGKLEEGYLGLTALVDGRGVLLASPDGTLDADGNAFWNADISACCNFGGRAVDDIKYLGELIAEIRGVYNVDPRRIFLVGHSNGGFMAHRLGCELAPTIAAVVSLAGNVSQEPIACRPAVPVSVLQIHGDQDATVLYDGGTNILNKGGGAYAGALETAQRWAGDDGCQSTWTAAAPIDLEATLPGAETTVSNFDGCPGGTGVTLWTIGGGGHIPSVGARFPGLVWRWLDAHAR
ncbi:MAG: PHB depolymerase family esterase [Archangium sp.]|nr:PHB depolymerase family esterase [Archangium sp.]